MAETVQRILLAYRDELYGGGLLYSGGCPPGNISLVGGETVSLVRGPPAFIGSSSRIFLTADNVHAVKVVGSFEAFDGLCMERAVLSVVSTLGGGTVNAYPIVAGSMGRGDCARRTMVTDFVGMRTVGAVGSSLSPRQVASLAANVITIVQRLHAYGIIHGDIHDCQLVLGDPTDVATVKLIDFGRSVPYVDPLTGVHIPNDAHIPFSPYLGAGSASPFELEGSIRTRRDDMYRVAELLYRIRGAKEPDWGRIGDHSAKADFKRNWEDVAHGGEFYTSFHHAMANLGFDQDPDYSTWIAGFETLAQTV